MMQYALDNIVYMMTSWKPGHPEFESLKEEFDHLLNGVASIPFMWLRGKYYKAIKVQYSITLSERVPQDPHTEKCGHS